MRQQTGAAGSPRDDEALSVLRGIWSARRQTSADLADLPSNAKTCKNMRNVGIGGDGEPVDAEQRTAWRARLEREGKLVPGAVTVADLVLEARDRP